MKAPVLFETRFELEDEHGTFATELEAAARRDQICARMLEYARLNDCDQEHVDNVIRREKARKITKLEYRYANQHGYTDVKPYEIVRVVSDKCLEIRPMAYSDNKVKMEFQAGGFSAHCINNYAQDYDYYSNEEYETIRIRKHKSGEWKGKHGERFLLSTKPTYFYDYNF